MTRYLDTVKPLVSQEQYERTKEVVANFQKAGAIGPILQQRLLERAEKSEKGWLIEWWNEYAYMGYRDPVVIYVNYFFAFSDDKLRMNPTDRAASIIQGAMSFRDLVVSIYKGGSIMLGAVQVVTPLFRYLFNSTRIPHIPVDKTRVSGPLSNNHIVVLRKNQFFTIELQPDGMRLSLSDIKKQLDYIYLTAGEREAPIGVLTTENRDLWTQARAELLAVSDRNKKSLDTIETAAFVVCLDDSKPVTKDEHSKACWHGDGRNRFFDKSMQFVIFDNGKAGFNGEHSNMEATITHRACDWILTEISQGRVEADRVVTMKASPKKLDFDLSPHLAVTIDKAMERFDALSSKHDLRVATCEAYGKKTIKTFAVSPDSYAQMAIQLAYFKMYGQSRATYESAGTRKFLAGRTETGRSVSVESVVFVKAMQNPHLSAREKGLLARKAIASQSAYMAAAGDGRGVDRHFLGLKLSLKDNEQKPEIFQDPSFAKSSHWYLSTSQVTSEHYDGYGWGEVVTDGYGVAYMVKNDSLQFNLVSLKLNNTHFETYLHESLSEMKVVFEASQPEIKAKL